MPESINEDGQDFLRRAAGAEDFFSKIRKYLWNRLPDDSGDDECLTYLACALGVVAIDEFMAEYRLQIDNVLDGLPRKTDKSEKLLECIEQSYLLACELDEIWENYDENDQPTFYRLSEIQIKLLENLALVPGWPDIETLEEETRIGKQALEGKRGGNRAAEDAYGEFRGYAAHVGTLLVRMVVSESERTCG